MHQTGKRDRRYKIIVGLQIFRFVVAAVMLGLALYYRDVLLGALAVAFVALGTFTTWKRLQLERDDD